MPSQTVENYLKAIIQAQMALSEPDALVPMGQLATALGVVPGTATTMVKALADSGLARYEPYTGVRLTAAGEKLAALVLRRHRLIELFLVKVMGMSWTEVHDEAEDLEHAVSDRLIERIDEMLGRPAVDPHGDPIPDPEGTVPAPDYDSLLTCPLDQPVTVARVTDQDREFLQFAELHDLRPGDVVQVEKRDAASDSVRLRGRHNRQLTIGARAASKVLVEIARIGLVFLLVSGSALLSGSALAQTTTPPGSEPFRITDNSFLVEEAFNQEAGVFQNIFGATLLHGDWAATFTQEWPAPSQRHQLSYTVSWLDVDGHSGSGDALLNYRYQLSTEGPGRPAMSPRVSLVLPSGSVHNGLGSGSAGLQLNLPVSKQTGDWYWHWNAGMTWLPRAQAEIERPDGTAVRRENVLSPFFAASAIYRLRPMFHLVNESVASFDESVGDTGTVRNTTLTLSPGVRGGWDIGDHQLVVGLAAPVSWSKDTRKTGVFVYFSYELPFKK